MNSYYYKRPQDRPDQFRFFGRYQSDQEALKDFRIWRDSLKGAEAPKKDFFRRDGQIMFPVP